MAEERITVKLEAKEEDRISALSDHVIQHILTLLPSTKEAIRTTVLSKRWRNQWTRVPVLVFDFTGMSVEKFSRFIDYTLLLHDCSKIKKFHIQQEEDQDPLDTDILTINWDVIFRFAIKRDVEDLFMGLCLGEKQLRVPKFVFEHPSYVKLHMSDCDFSSMPNRNVSWPNIKELVLSYCTLLPNQAIENILSGSPSLESFHFYAVYPATQYDIISKSLKKLVLLDYDWSSTLQISCPNLEELDLCGSFNDSATLQLMNSSSLIRATLSFGYDYAKINNLMQYFKHVKELQFDQQFIKSLSALKSSGADLSPLLLNNKYLGLSVFNNFEEHNAGIECALCLSHVLQKLVIWLPYSEYFQWTTKFSDWNVSGENYWNSNTTVFNCLVSHLKIVEITNLSEGNYFEYYMFFLPFIEFLLKNARVLEKLVVRIKDGSKDFTFEVSQKLLEFPRCSQHATVKLLYMF